MKVLCFSSFTFSYLNRARVLFQSLRRHQPDWHLVALITDEPPAGLTFTADDEPFDTLVYARDLPIESFRSWLFKHDVIEVCTAVKGPFANEAVRSSGADAIVYLDPDTCVFNSMQPIEELLESWDIILTPHSLAPDTQTQAIIDNEICSLRTGIYNLGFCAFRTSGEGARFAKWWSDRLIEFCYDDIPSGLFVDQRWCDHVPALFEKVKILRDPGYNVASWNLSTREIAITSDGRILVNGEPLRFWHFTKLGIVGDAMTKRYAGSNFQVHELWNWYRRQVAATTDDVIPKGYWAYGRFANGVEITKSDRLLYRSSQELERSFRDPFATGPGSFFERLSREGAVLTRI
jgi:hypothetical protein